MKRALLHRLGVVTAAATTAGLAGCSGLPSESTPTDDSPRVGLTYGAGGGRCHEDVDEATTGWVHVVAHGESYDVTFDAIVGHEAGEEVDVTLDHAGMDDYVLTFSD